MSRCPYCHRELPGFETLCQRCFEAQYSQVATPWWQRRQLWHPPMLTPDLLQLFVFAFVYTLLVFGINAYNRLTLIGLALLISGLAGYTLLMGRITKDARQTNPARSTLRSFFYLVCFFALRLWPLSHSRTTTRNPALVAFVLAAVVVLIESTRRDPSKGLPVKTEQEKLPSPTKPNSSH
jgi:multisubunit Na+/H+ antiporter MnhC subunit